MTSHLLHFPIQLYGDTWAKIQRAFVILFGFGLSVNGVRTCGDYMFSGHTVTITLLNFFITECKYWTVLERLYCYTQLWLLTCNYPKTWKSSNLINTGMLNMLVNDKFETYEVATPQFYLYAQGKDKNDFVQEFETVKPIIFPLILGKRLLKLINNSSS